MGINEELSIDILSQTPLIPLCLNVANDAEKNIGIKTIMLNWKSVWQAWQYYLNSLPSLILLRWS